MNDGADETEQPAPGWDAIAPATTAESHEYRRILTLDTYLRGLYHIAMTGLFAMTLLFVLLTRLVVLTPWEKMLILPGILILSYLFRQALIATDARRKLFAGLFYGLTILFFCGAAFSRDLGGGPGSKGLALLGVALMTPATLAMLAMVPLQRRLLKVPMPTALRGLAGHPERRVRLERAIERLRVADETKTLNAWQGRTPARVELPELVREALRTLRAVDADLRRAQLTALAPIYGLAGLGLEWLLDRPELWLPGTLFLGVAVLAGGAMVGQTKRAETVTTWLAVLVAGFSVAFLTGSSDPPSVDPAQAGVMIFLALLGLVGGAQRTQLLNRLRKIPAPGAVIETTGRLWWRERWEIALERCLADARQAVASSEAASAESVLAESTPAADGSNAVN